MRNRLLHTTPIAILRNAAVTLLHESAEFRHVSRRLLSDLIEQIEVVRITDTETVKTNVFLLVVIEGTLAVSPTVPIGVPSASIVLMGGVYWAGHGILGAVGDEVVELKAARDHAAYIVHLDKKTFLTFLRASPALGSMASLRLRLAPGDVADVHVERVWVAKAGDLAAPLAALTQLLAAAVGSQFDEPTGIVTLGAGAELVVWEKDHFTSVPLADVPSHEDVRAKFTAHVGRPQKLHHLFFIHPADPSDIPPPFAGPHFHRVVYVTDVALSRIPRGVTRLLHEDLLTPDGHASAAGTYFSSFIPAIVVKPKAHSAKSSGLGTVVASLAASVFGSGFQSESIDDGYPGRGNPGPNDARRRLRKDHCRIAFDLDALARDWQAWNDGRVKRGRSFPAYVFADREREETSRRWARSVTNRRVGVALSGGGACAYRALPLIEMLRRLGVPIDLFSGVSGGALIGAYYCKDGIVGLKRARSCGPRFLLATIGAMLWSGFIERLVDVDLGGTRVEELEVLFLPVTTALADPPAARVVVSGTLGEAVRASGSAPVAFGPTRKGGVRYADGATATMIPAKVLSDYGADLVLACNCIPGPKYGNPFGTYLLGRLVYEYTPVGRLIDGWVASSFLLTTASRLAGTDAQVYWEPSLVDDPLLETVHFEQSYAIVRRSLEEDGPAMWKAAAKLHGLWQGLGT
ncbi:MAG: hypothetical protein HY271_10180 [Deltaproteobacteria bacterium]|nr:hypothetical protein [Deltaproteobacteria bacterium]